MNLRIMAGLVVLTSMATAVLVGVGIAGLEEAREPRTTSYVAEVSAVPVVIVPQFLPAQPVVPTPSAPPVPVRAVPVRPAPSTPPARPIKSPQPVPAAPPVPPARPATPAPSPTRPEATRAPSPAPTPSPRTAPTKPGVILPTLPPIIIFPPAHHPRCRVPVAPAVITRWIAGRSAVLRPRSCRPRVRR